MHTLKQSDVKKVKDYLERAFSDDVNVTIFLHMVEEEDTNHTFEHPPNWNQLTTQH